MGGEGCQPQGGGWVILRWEAVFWVFGPDCIGLDQPGPEGEVRISYQICPHSWKNQIEKELRVCLLRPSPTLGLRSSAQPPASKLSFATPFSKDRML